MLPRISLVALFLSCIVSCVYGAPMISWVSDPVYPNETVIVQGSGFSKTNMVEITSLTSYNPSPKINVPIIQPNEGSLKFIIPLDFPLSAWQIRVYDIDTKEYSNPVPINLPTLWWVQGDQGNTSSPGGWLRVFGKSINFPTQLKTMITSLKEYLEDAMAKGNYGVVAELALQLEELEAKLRATSSTYLKLVPKSGGKEIIIPAETENVTEFSAYFPIPPTLALGTYDVFLTNGFGTDAGGTYVALESFVETSIPPLTYITVSSVDITAPRTFKDTIFNVKLYGPTGLPPVESDQAIQGALNAALKNGGGVVYFPRGNYFVTEPILVSPGVLLKGEGTDLVTLIFQETPIPTKAPPTWFGFADETYEGAWGMEDFTFYITSFHKNVIEVTNHTNGFHARRIRARVNAWFAQNLQFTATRERWANFTWQDPGDLFTIHGTNWEITDCDLFSSYRIINSYAWDSLHNRRHHAHYGRVAGNLIYNAAAATFMNQWEQAIVENNKVMGIALMAMGNALGTSEGGVAQHIYNANNVFQFVWGNDREVLTFDNAGGAYYGKIAKINGTTIITAKDTKVTTTEWDGWFGGSVVILNGTGAGQYRRIVIPGVFDHPTPTNRTWIINKPFTIDPGPDSWIEIMPFRGQNIFYGNTYIDVGAFQFYGHAIENIVSHCKGERMTGFLSWGQWRPPASLKGPCCQGMQPNLMTQFLDNEIIEGNKIVNYNSPQILPAGFYNGHSFITLPMEANGHDTPSPANNFIVYRRNIIDSNGGVLIGQSSSNIVVEHTVLKNTDLGVTIDNGTSYIFVH